MNAVTRRGRIVGLVILGAALAVKLWSFSVLREERVLHLVVACEGDECQARIDGGEPLSVTVPADRSGGRVGLYVYHSGDPGERQYFRKLSVEGTASLDVDLTRPEDLARFTADSGWTTHSERGMTHGGVAGQGSIALLEMPVTRDFVLELDLVSSRDAGVLLRAADAAHGTLLVVRERYNDAFFCPIEDGRTGAIQDINALRELRVGRESLRLAGLAAEILIASLILAALLRLLAPLGPRIRFRLAPRTWRAVIPVLFAVTVAVSACVAVLGFGAIPHINDEAAYLFQAKVFAGGQAWAPVPALPEFFRHEHLITGGDRWFAKYPPLFPLLLSAGLLAGAPWLVNPLLAALTALVTFYLAREICGKRWAIVAWLVLLASPWFVIMGGSLMSHMTSALLVTLALLMAIRATRRDRLRWTILAGACLGAALFARPYTSLLASIAVGGYYVVRVLGRGDRRRALRHALLFGACVLPFIVAFLGWNWFLTSVEAPTINLYAAYDATDVLGFGADKGSSWWMTWGSWGHTPGKALRSVHQYLSFTSHYMLGWPVRLSLSLLIASFFFAWRKAWFWPMIALLGLLVVGHMFYWATQHLGHGARYWFAGLPVMAVLSTVGLRGLLEPRRSGKDGTGETCASGFLGAAALLLVLVAWNVSVYFPQRWHELYDYGGVSPDLKYEVSARELSRSIVFVETEGLIYNDGFFMNEPLDLSGVVFARDLGPRNVELMALYPGHRGYRWSAGRLEPL